VSTTARILVRAATTTLPSGAVRVRYRREHLGELSALPTTDQIHYAVGALATSWALRRALIKERDMTTTLTRPAKPMLCRLNLHHRWHEEHNVMGEPFRRCLRCGKDDPGTSGPPPANVHF
jgi:hypothetical protein